MDDHARIADYFLVTGLPPVDHPSRSLSTAVISTATTRQLDPITDITVIIKSDHEPVPPGWTCVDKTPGGYDANLCGGTLLTNRVVYLCYRRGRTRPPLVDISVMYGNGKEKLMDKCQVVLQTPSKFPANVNSKTGEKAYLTYRVNPDVTSCNQFVVTDVCVINTAKGESPPHTFCLISKNLNKGMLNNSHMFLCYKKTVDTPPNIQYPPHIIDRFPLTDHSQYSLPSHVELFCLPMGATLECWPVNASPYIPTFSTFVLTLDRSQKVYGSTFNFYEKVKVSDGDDQQQQEVTLEELVHLRYFGKDVDSLELIKKKDDEQLKVMKQQASQAFTLQRSKSICILSHWPFFEQFRAFLTFLYHAHQKSSTMPMSHSLESYIFCFMKDILFPSPDRPVIQVSLHCSFRSKPSSAGARPQSPFAISDLLDFTRTFDDLPLPSNGASFKKLLLNLGPDNCCNILLFALTEQKILLHSLRISVLTEICEAIITMIFPFNWNCVYVPLCPIMMNELLCAPLPFIVGMDSRYFDTNQEDPPDVASIDVDTKAIYLTESKRHLNMDMFPRAECQHLHARLKKIHDRIRSVDGQTTRRDYAQRRLFNQQVETEIQEAFLYFMASILKDFRRFLKPITAVPKVGATDPSSLFDIDGWLKSKQCSNNIPFYQLLMKTQMFTKFIEERSLVSDKNVSLAFFDECIEKVKQHQQSKQSKRTSSLSTNFGSGSGSTTSSMCSLIENDDPKGMSNKTVYIAIPETAPNSPVKDVEADVDSQVRGYSYETFGPFDQQIFKKLESSKVAENNYVIQQNSLNQPFKSTTTATMTTIQDGSGAVPPELTSYVHSKRAKHEVRKWRRVCSQLHQRCALEWSKLLLYNVYSLWFTHFPAFSFILRSSTAAAASTEKDCPSSLSVAYEVLQRMQKVPTPGADEYCYRVLMILCGIYSQPAMAVKVFLTMRQHGIQLNAITYGYYNKAVLEGRWPSTGKWTVAKWNQALTVVKVVNGLGRKHMKSGLAGGESMPNLSTNGLNSDDTTSCTSKHSERESVDSHEEEVDGVAASSTESSPLPPSTANEDQKNDDSFSSRFTPLKGAFTEGVSSFFSPKSRFSTTWRSSLRAAKNLTKNTTSSSAAIPKSSTFNESPERSSSSSASNSLPPPQTPATKSQKNGIHRSSTLPQKLEHFSGDSPADQESTPTNNAAESPWSYKQLSNSEYVYSTIKLAANRINELKSSLNGSAVGGGGGGSVGNNDVSSPSKLNMAQVMASSSLLFSSLKNYAFDEVDDSEVTVNGCQSSVGHSQNEPYDPKVFNLDEFCDLFQLVSSHYHQPLESMEKLEPKTADDAKIVFDIQILSCSICSHCKAMLFDEQIMAMWSGDDSNLNTRCSFCLEQFVPLLTVLMKDKRISTEVPRSLDPISVPYLSPLVLRKELESILAGEDQYLSLVNSAFVDQHPIIYWNLLWYFARASLPSHLPGLALVSSTLNSTEMIQLNRSQSFDHKNVQIECHWDYERMYEAKPLYHKWIESKSLSTKSSSLQRQANMIHAEMIESIRNDDLTRPIKYLISDRIKQRNESMSTTSSPPLPFNSIYRDLLFLALSELNDKDGKSFDLDNFDKQYSIAYGQLPYKDKDTLLPHDGPPTVGAIFCRNLFKQPRLGGSSTLESN